MATSPIYGHQSTINHTTTMDNFNTEGMEGQIFTTTIKESIYTRVNNSTHHRNIGKYNFPHIQDRVIVKTARTPNQEQVRTSTSLVPSASHTIADNKHFPSDLMKPLCVIGKSLS